MSTPPPPTSPAVPTQTTPTPSPSSSSSTSSDSTHTTSSSLTSVSSSSSSSTSSSSATSPSQSSSTSTSTTPPTPASTSTPQVVTTTSGGVVQTVTTFVPASTSSSSTSQNNNSTSTNSFFSNKGAVIGVFTVVGVVVLALVIAFVVNTIRRRRAQEFDRDVAEAAAEAAAARSPFDDYSSYPNAGGKTSGGGYGYSDNSHGTFQLPPLQPHDGGPYGMTEMSQYDPYAAGAASLAAATAVGRSRSRKDSEPGAPGIAGVGAGTLGREPSRRAPYHAFAGPGPQPPQPPPELQGRNSTIRSTRGTNQDVLEAVGLAGPSGTAIASNNFNNSAGAGGAFVSRKPSEGTQNTHLSGRSQFGSMTSGGNHPMPLQPGYPVDSYYPQRNDNHSPDPFAPYPPPKVANLSSPLPNPHSAIAQSAPPLPGPQSDHGDLPDSPTALRSEEQRMSYQDDADYSQGNRVLRVTNE